MIIKKLSEICTIRTGKHDANHAVKGGKYRFYTCSSQFSYCDTKSFEGESIIVPGNGDIGLVFYYNGEFDAYQRTYVLSDIKINAKFLYYHMLLKWRYVNDRKKYGSTVKYVRMANFTSYEIPVPSSDEQERIVAKIEELFSQLDIGVETLRKIKQQLAVYRLAVLKAAYEGKYTQEWRINHPDEDVERDYCKIKIRNPVFKDTAGDENEIALSIPETWLKIRIGEIFDVEIGATPSRNVSEYWNGNIKWVSSGEVHFSAINETNEHITQLGVNNSSTKVQPAGTVLLAMIGEGKTRGQAAILNVPAAHNQNTAAILVSKTPCSPKYLYYFFMLNYENTRRVGSGNNQKALNKDRVKALRFPFTTFAEQAEIVREIELRLSVCDCIEQTVEKALQQAEALRQSILKQAFEGKL